MPNLTSLKPLLAIVIFYLLAFWLSLSYWAFRDARERSNSVLFHVFATGLSLVLPIFGLFIYMIIRPPLTMAERRALELETQALAEPGGPAREVTQRTNRAGALSSGAHRARAKSRCPRMHCRRRMQRPR